MKKLKKKIKNEPFICVPTTFLFYIIHLFVILL